MRTCTQSREFESVPCSWLPQARRDVTDGNPPSLPSAARTWIPSPCSHQDVPGKTKNTNVPAALCTRCRTWQRRMITRQKGSKLRATEGRVRPSAGNLAIQVNTPHPRLGRLQGCATEDDQPLGTHSNCNGRTHCREALQRKASERSPPQRETPHLPNSVPLSRTRAKCNGGA